MTLRDTLDFRTRVALRQTIRMANGEDVTEGEMLAALTEGYLLHCIDAWSLVDAKGKALPASRANIREILMADDDRGMTVADAADTLYSPVVLLPLLNGASKSSPATPTNGSTSPTTTGRMPQKPSKQSSTTSSQMVVTGPMLASPAGGSNSSPS